MKKAVCYLQVFYNVMVHVTSLAHGLHRIVEYICSYFDIVGDLVAISISYSNI